MKRALTLLVLIITPALACAQGTVILNNHTGLVKQWAGPFDRTVINVSKGGGYVQLIAAPKGTPLPHSLFRGDHWDNYYPAFDTLSSFVAVNPGWALASGDGGRTPAPPTLIAVGDGRFTGGTQTINNIAPGADADYFVIGWTGNYASYETAFRASSYGASLLGASAVATTSTGDPTPMPPEIPVALGFTFPGMTLEAVRVPEPTDAVLVGLGIAALMVVRQRR